MYFYSQIMNIIKTICLSKCRRVIRKTCFCEEKFDIIEVREKVLCISSKGIEWEKSRKHGEIGKGGSRYGREEDFNCGR